jgi:Plasmid pRiA4b ORF-3-like protein
MAETENPVQAHQFHVLLPGINPPIWRRLLVRSDSSVADLHHILQIAFRWSDFHLHRFLIRGTEYGISRAGSTSFTTDPKRVYLADFGFRPRERFLDEYDFSDLWQHQVRFEATRPVEAGRIYPVCVGGARSAPPEDCGGPAAYMELLDRHQLNWPHAELFLMAETLGRLLGAKDDENIRARLGNLDELQKAVESLEAYRHFRPDHFDRRAVNRRLRQYAASDEGWMWG